MTKTNISFSTELSKWTENTDLLNGILDMISIESLDYTEIDRLVKAFYIYPGDSVFTVWIATESKIILHERNLEGMTLTITFPLTRIRRVSQQNNRQNLILTLEFDADRLVFNGAASQSEDGTLTLSGSSLHSGYTLSADINDSDHVSKIVNFSKDLRSTL